MQASQIFIAFVVSRKQAAQIVLSIVVLLVFFIKPEVAFSQNVTSKIKFLPSQLQTSKLNNSQLL
jgi:hypothetical protein